jgi:HAD superfamily hydrolase (TIGR01509 family)
MTLKSLIFDFDGLILDTETPEFEAWRSIYREYGQELPAERWVGIVGGYGASDFDAAVHLLELLPSQDIDPQSLRQRHQQESNAMTASQDALPGVEALLGEARKAGLTLAIASSSGHSWVDSHLVRLGLEDRFDKIVCSEDVGPGRTKPHPDLFLKALDQLGVSASDAIVFEDSLNGVRAAKSARLFVVAVPNAVTSILGVDGADLTLQSLRDFKLQDVLKQFG